MGAPDGDAAADPSEQPRRTVTIDRGFLLGRTPVTRREFRAFVEQTGHETEPGCWTLTDTGWRTDVQTGWHDPGFPQSDADPVACVSSEDAQAYITWLSTQSGKRYRLPSEAEWEYAARAGTAGRNFWGDDARETCRYANVNDLSGKNKVVKVAEPCDDGHWFTSPVATFEPNAFGLHDMQGNVWEWVADCWRATYRGAPGDGSAVQAEGCRERVMRGGSWADTPGPVRITVRDRARPTARRAFTGFRVARDPE